MDFNKLSREDLIKLVQTQQNQIQRLQRSGLSGKKMKTNISNVKIKNDNDIMNLYIDFYEASKTQARQAYEKRVQEVDDQELFQKELKRLMFMAVKEFSFDVDIGDSECNRLAFTEMLRHCYKIRNKSKVVVKAYTLDGHAKLFTLSDKHDIESTIGHISGELDLSEEKSDTNPTVNYEFIPVKYDVLFLRKQLDQKGIKFDVIKEDEDDHALYHEEVEIDPDYRSTPEGSFFPFINLSNLDLSEFQIFSKIDKKKYKDNCFVYALIQSGVFSSEEI